MNLLGQIFGMIVLMLFSALGGVAMPLVPLAPIQYDPGRSTLTADPQDLLSGVHNGQYPIIRSIPRGNSTSNIVDFGKTIGDFKVDGVLVGPTQYGQIVQGKNGAHIIPANPNQY